MQVADLRRFLQERGVSCFFHGKYQLDELYKLAHEMNLEVITKNVDFNWYIIKNSNTTVELLKTRKNWLKYLKDVPAIENYDVMISMGV